MVLGDKLARGLVRRENRSAYENSQRIKGALDRCLEGKTKRASKFRAVTDLVRNLFAGRILKEVPIQIVGHKKDNANLWIVYDSGRDPSTKEDQIIVLMIIVPFRNPGEPIAKELMIFTEHAAQRLLQSMRTDDIGTAVSEATVIGDLAFMMFENGMKRKPYLESCGADEQVIILDKHAGWMPAEIEGDEVTIKTVIHPDALDPAKRRLLEVSLDEGKMFISVARKRR